MLQSLPLIWLGYAGIGALSGLLAGIFGIGGGFIIIPSLLFVFSLQGVAPEVAMHLAVGTSLASIVVSGSASALSHHRNGNVLLHRLRELVPGLMCGAIFGVLLASALSGGALRAGFGAFLVLLSLHGLSGWPRVAAGKPPTRTGNAVAGGLIGGTSALFGIGVGTLTIPWLRRGGAPIKQAIGTAAACGVPSALIGSITFVVVGWGQPALPAGATGYVMWPALFGIILASIPFTRLGAHVTHIAPARVLNLVFSGLMLLVGTKLLLGEIAG